MLYSYYCIRAPQTRYEDYDHVKKQMYKLHAPHKTSNYISTVEFRETTDAEGHLDWEMLYTPGRRAKAEFRAFAQTKRVSGTRPVRELQSAQPASSEVEVKTKPEADPLIEQLRIFGVTETKARQLVKSHREATEAQIAAFPYREVKQPKNAAGWLVAAIEGNYTLPALYLEEQEKKQQASKAKERRSGREQCSLCDEQGWRRVKSEQYPKGAMKRCSHDLQVEAKYQDA
jgi:hypothetical protein